eukprot:TRINITY_DN1517_c0_g1_i2.p1 TRINITY_DN1517_c0_g1~~TRINITY_DN1517_c0_g1_i2.p1  ORF type:complete len:676 (+),score=149.12 TRINITY_DN1517_c0_g1_i2:1826-3853(+)
MALRVHLPFAAAVVLAVATMILLVTYTQRCPSCPPPTDGGMFGLQQQQQPPVVPPPVVPPPPQPVVQQHSSSEGKGAADSTNQVPAPAEESGGEIPEAAQHDGPCFLVRERENCTRAGCHFCEADGSCKQSRHSCASCSAYDFNLVTCTAFPGCVFCERSGRCMARSLLADKRYSAGCHHHVAATPSLNKCEYVAHFPPVVWPTPTTPITGNAAAAPLDASNLTLAVSAAAPLPSPAGAALETAFARLSLSLRYSLTVPKPPQYSEDTVRVVRVALGDSPCDQSGYIQWGDDEAYHIEHDPHKESGVIQISAKTVWGAVRAFDSLQSVIECKGDLCCVPTLTLDDAPRYSWRGLLMDTSRHFLPVGTVLRVLESLAVNKFNILHWHITDGASFPLYVQSVPQLALAGAFGEDQIYTPEDVHLILGHANSLGIRILPELDMPGHTSSWGRAFPQFIHTCPSFMKDHGFDCGADPLHYNGYDGVGGWCDNYVHLGGDEVSQECYREDGTQPSLETFYNKVLGILKQRKKHAVFWEESIMIPANFPSDTIFETWLTTDKPKMVAERGFKLISGRTRWYFEYERDYRKYYEFKPTSEFHDIGSSFIGGECMMWGEYADQYNWFGKVFPAAAAVAEVLWANPQTATMDTFNFFTHLCEMQRRGIPVNSPGPGNCDPQLPS